MTNVLDRLPPGARVAIIRLRSLGDSRAHYARSPLLKQARPDLQIAVVVEDRFRAVFAGNPDVDQILAPNASSVSRFRPHLALNRARRRHQRAFDAGGGIGPARRVRPFSLPADVQRAAFRAPRKFWAWIARSIPPNISLRPCFIWECRRPKSRARDCSPSPTPARVPTPFCIPSRRRPAKPGRQKISWPLRKYLNSELGDRTGVRRGPRRRFSRLQPNIPACQARRSKK